MELERVGVGRGVGWEARGRYIYCTPRVVYIAFVYFSEKPPGSIILYISQKSKLANTQARRPFAFRVYVRLYLAAVKNDRTSGGVEDGGGNFSNFRLRGILTFNTMP